MYGDQFWRTDSRNIRDKNESFRTELIMEIISRKQITRDILELPQELRKHIYIFAMKRFWRDYVPVAAKVPSWYSYQQYLFKEKQKTILDNVHFLHLEFNTLPENKKWILGCQCDFCVEEDKLNDKEEHYEKFVKDQEYFKEHVSCYDDNVNPWNWRWTYVGYNGETNDFHTYIRNFDPECNRYIEPKDNIQVVRYDLRNQPLFFPEEI